MKNINDIKQLLSAQEQLDTNELLALKGGAYRDDKRRQRPGGGTTTSSPNKIKA